MNESDHRIADYLDGTMEARARAQFEADMLGDESLAKAVYRELGVRNALGEPEPELEPAIAMVTVRPGRTAWWRWFVPAAAVATALAIWIGSPTTPVPDVKRGNAPNVLLLSPALHTDGPPLRFQWTHIGGANAYRFEVFDARSDPIVEIIVPDTTWSDPSALPKELDGTWRVVALHNGGEIGRSPLRGLRYP